VPEDEGSFEIQEQARKMIGNSSKKSVRTGCEAKMVRKRVAGVQTRANAKGNTVEPGRKRTKAKTAMTKKRSQSPGVNLHTKAITSEAPKAGNRWPGPAVMSVRARVSK
jgi:hypothetical protein